MRFNADRAARLVSRAGLFGVGLGLILGLIYELALTKYWAYFGLDINTSCSFSFFIAHFSVRVAGAAARE